MSEHDEQPQPRISTVCLECGGDGYTMAPAARLKPDGTLGTQLAPKPCHACHDSPATGWRPGFEPPV